MFWKLHLLFITKGPLIDVNSVLGGQHFKLQGYYLLHGEAGRNSFWKVVEKEIYDEFRNTRRLTDEYVLLSVFCVMATFKIASG
jgi:hypothetical protein